MDYCTLILWAFGIVGAFKLYLKFVLLGVCKSYTCLVGKTAIITGANTGIGYYTALELAKRGCRVIVACRNKAKAEEAMRKIIRETNNQNVRVMLIDMESLDSVRNFAKEFNATEDRLDILVNNAGGVGMGDKMTKDGMQITMQVNHFSNVLLTDLLLDKLKRSAPSRIVNVSSAAAQFSKMTIDDLNRYPKQIVPEWVVYAHSKLCNILFTQQLAKELHGTGVTVNALHPGAVVTELARNGNPIIRIGFQIIGYLFFKTSEEGAQTTIYLSTSNDVDDVSGGLFEDCKQVSLYKSASNPALVAEVWKKSRELVGLKK